MTDGAGLAGNAAACYAAHFVELLIGFGGNQGLTDNQLQSLQSKIVVDVSIVEGNLAGSLINSYAGNRSLSSTSSV